MPARFCSQCGTKVAPGAKFCSECGFRLDGRVAAPAASGWQVTTAGLSVFGLLLVSGLAIWATILSPTPPKPAPGRGPSAAAGQGDSDQTAAAPPLELPAEVKTFIDDLAKKAAAAPDDKDLWIRLGKVYARAGQLDSSYDPKALAAFEHVLARAPADPEAIHGKADVFYDEGDHKQAIPLFERYLSLAGDDPSARTDLATMYLSAGDAPKAMATYREVLAKHPDFLQAHYNLAVAHAQLGDAKAALGEFKQARALATDDKVRQQIDEMMGRLTGERPAVPPPSVAAAGPSPSAPAADAGPRSPFQEDVEKRLRPRRSWATVSSGSTGTDPAARGSWCRTSHGCHAARGARKVHRPLGPGAARGGGCESARRRREAGDRGCGRRHGHGHGDAERSATLAVATPERAGLSPTSPTSSCWPPPARPSDAPPSWSARP